MSPPNTTAKFTADLLQQYSGLTGVHDELRDANSELRLPWQKFFSHLEQTEPEEMTRRWDQTQRLIRENGIAYGAYLEEDRETRPWQLDALPLLIEGGEWERVECALQQRAYLLELILADLYGPQDLISRGSLPADILFANPGHWRAFHGQHPVGGSYLRFYAADMGRAADGSWWILGDRSEAPSGIGFALENRVVLSRMFPTAFRECGVQRLAPFFKTLQEAMQTMAPRTGENARVVLLSNGPTSEGFFEDAYLARYLGHQLVEGQDLTVRDGRVMIKTLGALLPVDVIMRRSDSASCDPLELEEASERGVAGLVQAAREGSVAICNALGSGLVESPILMAYMPRLCKELLGEPLKLPGVATWWCGEPESRAYVLQNLERLTVKQAFRDRDRERQLTMQLQSMPPEALAAMIKRAPSEYVAQERFDRSSVPHWRGGRFTAAHVALRSYVVAANQGFHVLPGGLARTSAIRGSLETSILDGEGSKDTWVMSDRPVEPVSLLPRPGAGLRIRRSGADLPSRVADDLFWLGRYLERADATVRLLRTVTMRLTSESDYRSLPSLPHLVRAMAAQGQIEPGFAVDGIRELLPELTHALPKGAIDRDESGGIRAVLEHTMRIAGKVRDRLSVDSWRILLRMVEQFEGIDPAACDLTELLNLTNDTILDLAAFSGTIMESMTRTQSFRFLELGRRLERAMQLINLIEATVVPSKEISTELLEAILEVADSLMTYRSRYMANLQLAAALDLLLTDETNPRSLAFQLVALRKHVDRLPRRQDLPKLTRDERLAMSMLHNIRMIDIDAICQHHSLESVSPLQALLQGLRHDLPLLSNAISDTYLVHSGRSQQLSEIRPTEPPATEQS